MIAEWICSLSISNVGILWHACSMRIRTCLLYVYNCVHGSTLTLWEHYERRSHAWCRQLSRCVNSFARKTPDHLLDVTATGCSKLYSKYAALRHVHDNKLQCIPGSVDRNWAHTRPVNKLLCCHYRAEDIAISLGHTIFRTSCKTAVRWSFCPQSRYTRYKADTKDTKVSGQRK